MFDKSNVEGVKYRVGSGIPEMISFRVRSVPDEDAWRGASEDLWIVGLY